MHDEQTSQNREKLTRLEAEEVQPKAEDKGPEAEEAMGNCDETNSIGACERVADEKNAESIGCEIYSLLESRRCRLPLAYAQLEQHSACSWQPVV